MYPIKTKAPYDQNNLSATGNIYTTVYLGNYITGDFSEGSGSHLGVDIIPLAKHDNIYACLKGSVFFAGTNDSNGNYIILKHDGAPDPTNLSSATTLYSCYLHLSELNAVTGNQVNEGDVIGKTGNTGNSTGEHLHFQIDTGNAPFHPYWPFKLQDAVSLGLGFMEAVNKGLGIDNAKMYSINPLAYLNQVAAFRGQPIFPINIDSTPITKPKPNLTPAPSFVTKSKYFSDVKDDADAIDYLSQKGIIKGYGDGTFRPKSNITRAELLAMALNFDGMGASGAGNITFSDVPEGTWYAPYVSAASSKGFINGYQDGTFRPNNPITRAEAAAVVLNIIIGKQNIPSAASSDYQDVSTADWYCKYTNYISENGLMDSIGRFYPKDNLNRGDCAVLLYNLKNKV